VARSAAGIVLGGAGVSVALGSASSPPQAMAKSKTALNIAIRTKSDFLTGEPPIFKPDQSILQHRFRHVSTLLFLSQSGFGVNAPAHDFDFVRHPQNAGPDISKKPV
jgi:hypothetical protein